MKKRDTHTATNKGGQGSGAWLSLLQWLRLLVLSLSRINHYKPDRAFYKPILSSQNHILAENSTKTQTLTATKLTKMNPAHKYLKWSVLLLFAFMAKFASAQTSTPTGPYQFTGDDNVCVGQTKNYGVADVPGSTYSWSITGGTAGTNWIMTGGTGNTLVYGNRFEVSVLQPLFGASNRCHEGFIASNCKYEETNSIIALGE